MVRQQCKFSKDIFEHRGIIPLSRQHSIVTEELILRSAYQSIQVLYVISSQRQNPQIFCNR